MHDLKSIESGENEQENNVMLNKMHKRRIFQRQACLISVMAAFVIGLSLGVFVPVIGLGTAISNEFNERPLPSSQPLSNFQINNDMINGFNSVDTPNHVLDIQFPTIYDIQNADNTNKKDSYAVRFVTEGQRYMKRVNNRNDADTINSDTIIDSDEHLLIGNSKKREKSREITLERTPDGKHAHFMKQPFLSANFKRLNKNNGKKYISIEYPNELIEGQRTKEKLRETDENPFDAIDENIFWGKIIEDSLPNGFGQQHIDAWTAYVNKSVITKLEIGCGRMQNRLVTFQDGRQACARYRQNTDQIQGELFSFYLGQLLNLSNLAPSTASIIDLNAGPWLSAAQDIQNAQWKSQRPVVLTDWIPKLEAANIPPQFQPMERHLNKFDVKNITLGLDMPKLPKSLLDHLGGTKRNPNWNQLPVVQHSVETEMNKTVQQKLVELAQWSDLIVFDYLIANLDRVVNNLYNFQWNADIMAAPAHNLARQSDSQLLVFLDNESGLLHGYRLLKKYETYHGLLLDNLCVFRRPTIAALQQLQTDGIGKRLQQLFEQSTTGKVRDVLPSLPDKSIKILVDRIDRVLGQVQKCRELFSNR